MRPFHLLSELANRCKDFTIPGTTWEGMPWKESRVVMMNRHGGLHWEISIRYIADMAGLKEIFRQWAEVNNCVYSEMDRFGNMYFYFKV